MTTAWGDQGHVNWHWHDHTGCTDFHSKLLEDGKVRDMINGWIHKKRPNLNISPGACDHAGMDNVWHKSGEHDGHHWSVTVWMH